MREGRLSIVSRDIYTYAGLTLIGLLVTDGIYYLTVFTIGHSLLLFASLQSLLFILLSIRAERRKRLHIAHLTNTIYNFKEADTIELLPQTDQAFNYLSRQLADFKQQYLEESKSYRLAQLRFLHILKNMNSTVILLNSAGKIQFMNAAGEALFQVNRLELVNKTHWKIGKESDLSKKIEEARKKGQMIKYELKLEYPAPKLIEATIVPA